MGEMLIFDGHNLIIHVSTCKKGSSTVESRAERFSMELRVRCKCKVKGCGLPPFEEQWPFKAPTSFTKKKDVISEIGVDEYSQVEQEIMWTIPMK